MIRGLYTSVSGLITLQHDQETITNNIANAENNGYKKRALTKKSFGDVMISNRQKVSGQNYVRNNIGTLNMGVKTNDIKTVFTQGPIKYSDSATDFAIDGRGFFVVKKGNQQLYTRDGNFKINQQGYLITSDGSEVLGKNSATGATEHIYIGNNKFSLDGENNIQIDGIGTTNKLLTADFDNYGNFEPMGDNYTTSDNPRYDAKVSVQQHALEKSNVDQADELVKLMEVKRQFETNQKMVKMQDETLDKAANQIGRV